MVIPMTAAVLWLLLSISAPAVSSDRGPLIAQSDGGKVFLRMIACAPGARNCHAQEQERLARRIHRQWLHAAISRYGVRLTPEEEQRVARQTSADESHIQASAARFHALYEAAVRVRRGEDRTRVDADLTKKGITPHDFDLALEYVPTLADAQRAAARDFVAEVRESVRESYAQPFLIQHLRELVTKRATAGKASFDVAEERFWSEISRDTHTHIIDPAYTMPARKGVLER